MGSTKKVCAVILNQSDLFFVYGLWFAQIGIKSSKSATFFTEVLNFVEHGRANMSGIIYSFVAKLTKKRKSAFKRVAQVSPAAGAFITGWAGIGLYMFCRHRGLSPFGQQNQTTHSDIVCHPYP